MPAVSPELLDKGLSLVTIIKYAFLNIVSGGKYIRQCDVGNSPVTGEFPAQMASNAENISISWRHHVTSFKPT